MAAAVYGLDTLLMGLPPLPRVALAGGAGVLIYLGLGAALRVEALGFFLAAVARRARR
jgi:arginine exporter protein ArgO